MTVPEEFQVGAGGRDLFRVFVLPTGLTEDKYVSAFQVRPGNPRVVHHAVNYFDTTTSVYGNGTATCPVGYRVTGGGFYTLPADRYEALVEESYTDYTYGYDYEVTGSYPNGTTGWKATASLTRHKADDSLGLYEQVSSYTPRVWATCTK